MKKIIIFICTIIFTLSAVSCGRKNDDKINENKTQLYVGVYSSGTPSDSMYYIAKEFEKKYENVSFENGKMGVEVKIAGGRYDSDLVNTITDMTEEVFYATAANASYLAKKGLLKEITDVYNTPLNYDFVTKKTDENGNPSLMKDVLRDNIKTQYLEDDGKYYGFADTISFYGLVYDVDLFDEYNLYFAKNGGFIKNPSDEKSAGPDNDYLTEYDNGLPATYDDFFTLCDKIVSLDMTPVMWGGNVQEYMSSLLTALACDNDGVEQTELNYNYDGTANTLVKGFVGDKPIIDDNPTKITAKNGYELYRQEGRYYALKFLERLVSNPDYYNGDATEPSFYHTDAQDAYLMSKYSSNRKRTAMLVEGTWWNEEARGTFLEMSAEYGEKDSVENRRFALLPFPKATEDKLGQPFTILERCVGDSFINANIEDFKLDLAKSFVQYMFQEETFRNMLEKDFSVIPVTYGVDSFYDGLTPWAKNMVDIYKNADVATMYSRSKIMENYQSELWYSPKLWMSVIKGSTKTYPSLAMINENTTSREYFSGLQAYWTPDVWASKFTNV